MDFREGLCMCKPCLCRRREKRIEERRAPSAKKSATGALNRAVRVGVQAMVAARCKAMAWWRVGVGAGADPARIWPCGRDLDFSWLAGGEALGSLLWLPTVRIRWALSSVLVGDDPQV